MIKRRRKTNKTARIVRMVLGVLAVFFGIFLIRFGAPLRIDTTYVLREGAGMQSFYDTLSRRERVRLKWYLRRHAESTKTILPGSYVFSGTYSPARVMDVFQEGPTHVYEHITILEGRSSRDIDASLTEDAVIEKGAYHAFITDPDVISRYAEKYDFLQTAIQERGALSSLEGYLYPDTFFVDPSKEVLDQLVTLQLDAFNTRIWVPYGEQLKQVASTLNQKGYTFSLSTYGAIILASIIEKEERAQSNKPSIASIFFNRLEAGMRLDADISLCYGLQEPYAYCTPTVIVNNLKDSDNLYNTRARAGLPPTPISNPHISSITALLDAPMTNNIFYLHDSDGQIHVSETLSEHNDKKSKYLQ